MGWASMYIERLRCGETVVFRPRGNSMEPRIKSGQQCTVEPCGPADVFAGDVVLCRVHGAEFLHIVKAVHDGLVEISNNKGRVNGWTAQIYGKLVKVEP